MEGVEIPSKALMKLYTLKLTITIILILLKFKSIIRGYLLKTFRIDILLYFIHTLKFSKKMNYQPTIVNTIMPKSKINYVL